MLLLKTRKQHSWTPRLKLSVPCSQENAHPIGPRLLPFLPSFRLLFHPKLYPRTRLPEVFHFGLSREGSHFSQALSQNFASKRKAAFTLMELLVTIVVIIILAALLITGSQAAIESSKTAKCAANLRQIGMAALTWSGENDGKIVSAYEDFENQRTWAYKIGPYLGAKLPTTYDPDRYDAPSAVVILQLPVFQCPNQAKAVTWPGYGYNSDHLSLYRTSGNPKRWVRYNQVERQSQTVMITDQSQVATNRWKPFVRPPTGLRDAVVDFRHAGKKGNVLWVDGHITSETATSDMMTVSDSFWKIDKDD